MTTHHPTASQILKQAKRIVIKIGTESIIQGGHVHKEWLAALADDIAALKSTGKEVFIVSSGAIGLGRGILKIDPRIATKDLSMDIKQKAACAGQPLLMLAYIKALAKLNLIATQILITRDVPDNPKQVANLRNVFLTKADDSDTIKSLVPIINEDDALATEEITFGDNDGLAAVVAKIVDADALVLLSKEDGLMTDNPNKNPNAKLIPFVPDVREAFQYVNDDINGLSRGGKRSKLMATQVANEAGIPVILARGQYAYNPLRHLILEDGNFPSTVFAPLPR